MTGYHISIGYNSDCSADDSPELWKTLKAEVKKLRELPNAIVQEVCRCEGVDKPDDAIRECAEMFSQAWADMGDQRITVIEADPAKEDDKPQIMLMASGGEPGRSHKERTCRAFCRLVINAMHRLGIEVCLTVA